MKTALQSLSVHALKIALAASVLISLNACGSKDDKSDTKNVSINCGGEGVNGYMSDGKNYAACGVKDGIGGTFASSADQQGGTEYKADAKNFKTGEVITDENFWIDDNYGAEGNKTATQANVCRKPVAKPVIDSEKRSWGFENGASCIVLP